jgi:replicative superfamily II helicase
MVDFKKLRTSSASQDPIEPTEIFLRLAKDGQINDLYTSQSEVLKQWFDRRNERDLVIKLHTGGGKTLVGLLIAQSILNERKEPVVYLCPTKQLVSQTLQQAREYGITAIEASQSGDFDAAFIDAKAVMVCNYHVMFNGKSRFGLKGSVKAVPLGTIILDDAHSSFGTLRDCFALTIDRKDVEELYSELTSAFRDSFQDLGRVGTFDDLVSGRESGHVLEIPYWSWLERQSTVLKILQQWIFRKEFEGQSLFHWPLVRDNLRYCTCLITDREVVITPPFPLMEMIPSFGSCPRRIYMSATISDDSSIVRTFDADPESVAKPLTSPSLAGVSERMILIPELTPISDSAKSLVHALVEVVSKEWKKGALILAPSSKLAKQWEPIAKFPQVPNEISQAINNLRNNTVVEAIVLANRYDGIDLPGDSCRLLVISNLPRGVSAYELHQAATFARGELIDSEIGRRLEQGIGRGGRGPKDYYVVVLIGLDLVNWISKRRNQALLTTSSRSQIQIGFEIANEVQTLDDFVSVVDQCLDRNPDWKAYHAQRLAELTSQDQITPSECKLAGSERKAFRAWMRGDREKAIDLLRKLAESTREEEPELAGWYYQFAARIAFDGRIPELSQGFQHDAYALNSSLLRPRDLMAATPITILGAQAHALAKHLESYAIRWGVLSRLKEIESFLTPNATSNQFEQAFADLGALIGLAVDRPDNRFGIGPDVLWIPDTGPAFVLEAKTRKKSATVLSKEEHGQLLNAEEWFKQTYPNQDSVRVCIHPNAFHSDSVVPGETLVLTWTNLAKFTDAIDSALKELAQSLESGEQLVARCQRSLENHSLTAASICAKFFELLQPFENRTF